MSEFSSCATMALSDLFEQLKLIKSSEELNALIKDLKNYLDSKEESPSITLSEAEINARIYKHLEEFECRRLKNSDKNYLQRFTNESIQSMIFPNPESNPQLIESFIYLLGNIINYFIGSENEARHIKLTEELSDGSVKYTHSGPDISHSISTLRCIPEDATIEYLNGGQLFMKMELEDPDQYKSIKLRSVSFIVREDTITNFSFDYMSNDSNCASLEQLLGILTEHRVLCREEGVWVFNEVTPEQFESTFKPFISSLSGVKLFRTDGKGYALNGEQYEDSEEEDAKKESEEEGEKKEV